MDDLVDIQFLNGYVLESNKKKKIQGNIFEVLRNGLPEEAHTIEITKYILEQCIDSLSNIGLKL